MTDCNPHCTLIDKAFGGHIRPNNKICLFPVTLLTLFFVKIVFSFLIKKIYILNAYLHTLSFSTLLLETKIVFVWPNLVFKGKNAINCFMFLNMCFLKPKEIAFDIFEKK